MKLTILYKDEGSGGNGCPSVYLSESGEFVVQGLELDASTFSELKNVLPGENAIRISAEVIFGAVDRYRSQEG